MGSLYMFREVVENTNVGQGKPCGLEVLDDHGVPELRIGPPDEVHKGLTAAFENWHQFERFVDAVNSLHFRLKEVNS